jgi:hypothetical protein
MIKRWDDSVDEWVRPSIDSKWSQLKLIRRGEGKDETLPHIHILKMELGGQAKLLASRHDKQ